MVSSGPWIVLVWEVLCRRWWKVTVSNYLFKNHKLTIPSFRIKTFSLILRGGQLVGAVQVKLTPLASRGALGTDVRDCGLLHPCYNSTPVSFMVTWVWDLPRAGRVWPEGLLLCIWQMYLYKETYIAFKIHILYWKPNNSVAIRVGMRAVGRWHKCEWALPVHHTCLESHGEAPEG